MRKRYWLTGTIVAAVMVLGIMGGVAMAQETSDEDGDSERQSFAARVADILGLDETSRASRPRSMFGGELTRQDSVDHRFGGRGWGGWGKSKAPADSGDSA